MSSTRNDQDQRHPVEMTPQEVMQNLPHRFPVLLLDRVLDLQPEKGYCRGLKVVSANDPHMMGHFPGNPIFPGVLIIESLAQLLCAYGFYCFRDQAAFKRYFLLGVDKARFRRAVVPGDRLFLEGRQTKQKRDIFFFECIARVEDEVAAQASLMLMFSTKA